MVKIVLESVANKLKLVEMIVLIVGSHSDHLTKLLGGRKRC